MIESVTSERRQAQLLLVLSPEGGLAVELPGANGSRRKVTLPNDPTTAVSCLRRMLLAQQAEGGPAKIGTSAAPTQWDIDRWAALARAVIVGESVAVAIVTKYDRAGTPLPASPDDIGL